MRRRLGSRGESRRGGGSSKGNILKCLQYLGFSRETVSFPFFFMPTLLKFALINRITSKIINIY